MPLVCKIIPNRTVKRRFKASDVGRVACYALESGATQEDIVVELRNRCMPDITLRRSDLMKLLLDILDSVLKEFLIRRLGAFIQVVSHLLRRTVIGRRLLAYLEDLVDKVVPGLRRARDIVRDLLIER